MTALTSHVSPSPSQIQNPSPASNMSMRKSVSTSAFSSLMPDIAHEIQMESVLHVPAFVVGQCRLDQHMIEQSPQVKVDDEVDAESDVVHAVGTCLVTPMEHDFGSLQRIRNIPTSHHARLAHVNDVGALNKYMSIMRSRRRRRKTSSSMELGHLDVNEKTDTLETSSSQSQMQSSKVCDV
jgi:hypothetical protein